jgi:hypothetical protein
MSNLKFRGADEQCGEYVMEQRQKQRRIQADAALEASLKQMTRKFGVTLTLGALFRYVGLLMIESGRAGVLRGCRRYLAKCIVKGVLTRRRVVH